MSFDVLLLLASGVIAVLAGGLVLASSPARYPSVLAAAALASLGLLEFGWARALYREPGVESGIWFELTLAFALPVTLSWVLLSRALGGGPRPGPLGAWRYYIVGQALFAAGVLVWVATSSTPDEVTVAGGGPAYALRPAGVAILVAIQLNLVLAAAGFESTFLAFPRGPRRAFLPGLTGILLAAGYFTYVVVTSLVTGRVAVVDLSLSALPVVAISLLLPISLVRGRVGEAHVRRAKRPLTRTTSLAISMGVLIAITTLLTIARATGWSLARSLWLLIALSASLGLAGLAVSNRMQRRLQRLVDPYLAGRAIDTRAWIARLDSSLEVAPSFADLCRSIPRHAHDVVGVEPVTLFWREEDGTRFAVVSSTLETLPSTLVGNDDPLAIELRRAGRAIRLRSRSDDLEFIPIYVENAAQLALCQAACAAPILFDDELVGFLLCGEQRGSAAARRRFLTVLDLACRLYAGRFEGLRMPNRPMELSGPIKDRLS